MFATARHAYDNRLVLESVQALGQIQSVRKNPDRLKDHRAEGAYRQVCSRVVAVASFGCHGAQVVLHKCHGCFVCVEPNQILNGACRGFQVQRNAIVLESCLVFQAANRNTSRTKLKAVHHRGVMRHIMRRNLALLQVTTRCPAAAHSAF